MRHDKLLWDLEAGQQLAAELESVVRPLNYHTLLGGGVLHKGYSDKDLDLWFMPLNGYPSQSRVVLQALEDVLGRSRALRDHPDYAAGEPYYVKEMVGFTVFGKRLDVFIR